MKGEEVKKLLLAKYGVIAQLKKIKEEVDELIFELCNPISDKEKIVTELADCLNTTSQMPLIAQKLRDDYDISTGQLIHERHKKYIKAYEKYIVGTSEGQGNGNQ